MYNTSKILNKEDAKIITRDDILAKVTDYDIFAKYIGDFKIGHVYKSPLRSDNNPSFAIFVDKKTGTLLYKDLASGDCGDAFKFVKKLKLLNNYKDTLIEISSDLNINDINIKLDNSSCRKVKDTKISIVRKPFNESDLRFWVSFGIHESTLKLFNVSSVSKYIVENVVRGLYNIDNPIYAYKVFNKFKIYRPKESKAKKWRSNLSALDIQGFEQLPASGDMLIITKSLKDVMSLYELGFTAIAPASESTIIPEIVINNIKSRFKHIVVFYDRDKTGMSFTREMVRRYKFDFLFINKKYKTKDISDFILKYGSTAAIEFLVNNL